MKPQYEYLPDGSKLSALAGSGAGYKYRGSFVYSVDASGNEKLESVACDEGRISVTYNSSGAASYRDDWHVRDYLGNTRLVVNITSASTPPSTGILEKSDYLPFGTRVATSSTPLNRWRQSGKEEQVIGGNDLGVLDFGARHYDPWLARWTTQDPMAGKYTNLSPYSYCAENPVNLVDDDGRVPHIIVGALIGGGISGAIALYQGKTGKEFWGAVGGGAVEGAITSATGGVGMISKGASIVKGLVFGAIGGVAGSATEQYITTETVEVEKTIVDGASGAISGRVSARMISPVERKAINLINQKYESSIIREEIYKEVKNSGQPIGKTTKQRINREVTKRAGDLKNADIAVLKTATFLVDEGQKKVVNYVSNKVSYLIEE